ncbi:LysR family transcriptional regulator [Aquamicrobium sp. LC103]|uniref:LysR family transcriptional regulator n=1 Tax=Aquamicrobium sp. LC103 TaxID=1120658 RepID=UPI0010C9F45C|nr:LysR family transcriptional regulator [Aquamicrobium sp. LC103]TKT82535.1 LysR family transcriptional regulator [Aquamicrobium sp. LC103]
MHPNLVDHLSAFILVADRGSFSAAARELGRAVSSVSYSLAQLEAHCGFPLLERGARRAELTERGRALYAEARAVVERARRFSSHASTLEKGEETRIRIAVDVLFPIAALHEALKEFTREHERARLQFFTSSLNTLWDDLRDGHVDFALALLAALPIGMEGRSFRQVSLSPAVASSHRFARQPGPLTMSDFEGERQIYYVGSHAVDMERSGRTFSSDVWTANDLEHIRLMIRHGFGWCFATEFFFEEELRAGTVRLLRSIDAQLHPTRSLGAVWPVDRQPGPLGRKLIDLIAETATPEGILKSA